MRVIREFVPHLVNLILRLAREHRASDVHLVPDEHHLRMQWRIDGVLHSVASFDGQLSPRIIARLKVLAGLLTYRTDVPQEGRISTAKRNWQSHDGGRSSHYDLSHVVWRKGGRAFVCGQ